MPYIFNDIVASPARGSLSILEDIYLQGGFRALKTERERDALPLGACKLGMLVRCLDVNKIFELFSLTIEYDEDFNEVLKPEWREFKITPDIVVDTPTAKPLTRWALNLRSPLLPPNESYKLKIPVSKLILVESVSVSHPCTLWLKETEADLVVGDGAVFNQILNHSFPAEKLVYDPRNFFPDGTMLRSRYTKTFMNKDPNTDKYIYYTVQNDGSAAVNITTKFLFVSLQLG